MKKILFIFLLFTFFSCKKEKFIDEELIRTGWVLTEVKDSDGSFIYEKLDSTNKGIYLVFTSDHQILGHTSFPITDTEYTIDDDNNMKMSIVGPRIILKHEWEAFFIAYNGRTYQYKIIDNKLILYFDDAKEFIFYRG